MRERKKKKERNSARYTEKKGGVGVCVHEAGLGAATGSGVVRSVRSWPSLCYSPRQRHPVIRQSDTGRRQRIQTCLLRLNITCKTRKSHWTHAHVF